MNDGFRIFWENEEEENVKATISKLPKRHQKLLHGYKFKYTPRNTLKGDNDHIGYIHKDKIVVAAPWNYSREMVTLHEIAHLVFEQLMNVNLKKEWSKLIAKTKNKQKNDQHKRCQSALEQNDEEIFAMTYAATYAKHPPKTYINKDWQKFITTKVPS
jgi:hypothetical protein